MFGSDPLVEARLWPVDVAQVLAEQPGSCPGTDLLCEFWDFSLGEFEVISFPRCCRVVIYRNFETGNYCVRYCVSEVRDCVKRQVWVATSRQGVGGFVPMEELRFSGRTAVAVEEFEQEPRHRRS
jgi:hypothetical protein